MVAAGFGLAVHLDHIEQVSTPCPTSRTLIGSTRRTGATTARAIALARPEWGDVYDRDIIGEAVRGDPDSFYRSLHLWS